MRYYNQTNYPHVPYPTLTDLPELGRSDTTVRDAGCGLCASCMVVENMTGREFPLIDCLELSINVNANHSPGTDLTVLGPYIAERFDLDLVITDDPELLRAHLKIISVYSHMAGTLSLLWVSKRTASISQSLTRH